MFCLARNAGASITLMQAFEANAQQRLAIVGGMNAQAYIVVWMNCKEEGENDRICMMTELIDALMITGEEDQLEHAPDPG
jgi:hypothetical protein